MSRVGCNTLLKYARYPKRSKKILISKFFYYLRICITGPNNVFIVGKYNVSTSMFKFNQFTFINCSYLYKDISIELSQRQNDKYTKIEYHANPVIDKYKYELYFEVSNMGRSNTEITTEDPGLEPLKSIPLGHPVVMFRQALKLLLDYFTDDKLNEWVDKEYMISEEEPDENDNDEDEGDSDEDYDDSDDD